MAGLVRGIAGGCEAATLCNQRGSPWLGPSRPSTSSVRRLLLPQDVGARDKPGQGAFQDKIRCKTLVKAALEFSRDSPTAGWGGCLQVEPGRSAPAGQCSWVL